MELAGTTDATATYGSGAGQTNGQTQHGGGLIAAGSTSDGHRSMSRWPTVSLVIPARNEARNIAWVLEQIPDTIAEVILVDGNSTDATLITARTCRPDIKVVGQDGPGKGSALRSGFLAATGDVIVMMDADGSMVPQEINHFLHFLENGYDFVKGSRFIGGGGSLDITRFRRLGNRFLLGVFNHLYQAELTDLCYGFCAFHRRYLEHLSLSSTGFEIEAEMVVRAMQDGLRIAEVPSLELPRRSGRSNLHSIRDGIRVLRIVLDRHNAGMPVLLARVLPASSDSWPKSHSRATSSTRRAR